MRRKTFSRVVAAAGLLLFASCASTGKSGATEQPHIGWLHGACMGLSDPGVRPGTAVTVVKPGSTDQVIAASVIGPARSGEACYPLTDGRREANLASGLTFYRLQLRQSVELGIGLVGRGTGEAPPPAALLDIDHDGRRETFTHCTTSEGVRFSIWSGTPHEGEPLWSGYYYLGYDTQADCPEE